MLRGTSEKEAWLQSRVYCGSGGMRPGPVDAAVAQCIQVNGNVLAFPHASPGAG